MGDDSAMEGGREPSSVPAADSGLQSTYAAFFAKYDVEYCSVLQVGADAGRLSKVLAQAHASRIFDYHVVAASSEECAEVQRSVSGSSLVAKCVVGDNTALAALPESHFNVVFAQSYWSHLDMYQQYRYLRDLRRVMRPEGLLMVNGVFLLGSNHDWGWSRFRRRVLQQEQGAQGVYHEFTGSYATIEMALRLGWEVIAMTNQAFIMRFRHAKKDVMFDKWADVPSNRKDVVFAPSLMAFLDKGKGKKRSIDFIQS